MSTKLKAIYPCASPTVDGSIARWKYVAPILRRELPRTLGNYFVATFEPKELSTGDSRRQFRCSIKRFLAWRGRPVGMGHISNELLDKFVAAEINRKTDRLVALRYAAHVRRVVNHRWPGRLPTGNTSHPLPTTRVGTIERFVEDVVLPERVKAGKNWPTIPTVRYIFGQLHAFYIGEASKRGSGVPFGRFDEVLCTKFLKWCVDKGAAIDTVDQTYRCMLQQVSSAAYEAGLMRRRLHIPTLSDRRRTVQRQRNQQRPSTANRNKGGRPEKWDHLKRELDRYLSEDSTAKPADLRSRYKSEHPQRPLPSPRSTTLRAYVSMLRASRREKQQPAIIS